MKIHFTAIGGSIMHALAIYMHLQGHEVSGSDDGIFDPSASRLRKFGLYPPKLGWRPEVITKDLDVLILGMHAKADNPELQKAQSLGITIQSFPEFFFEQVKDKHRIVVAGSHGKTSITAMIMHVLKKLDYQFDYMVGAQLKGFDHNVFLQPDSQHAVIEGDEYWTSAIDKSPKFIHYHPHTCILTGLEWDHVNVYPTQSDYLAAFDGFLANLMIGSRVVYNEADAALANMVKSHAENLNLLPYRMPEVVLKNHRFELNFEGESYTFAFWGKHNLLNMEAAKRACNEMGIKIADFYAAMQSFEGAGKRLELIHDAPKMMVFRDFAHAPSKLKATLEGIKAHFPNHQIVALFELHTFSSLDERFLDQYKGCADAADEFMVYYNPETAKRKKGTVLSESQIKEAFGRQDLPITQNLGHFCDKYLQGEQPKVVLFMSSANFGGEDIGRFLESDL